MNRKPLAISLSSNSAWSLYIFRGGLIRELLRQGYRVHIISPADTYTPLLEKLGCQIHGINISSKGSNPLRDGLTLLHYWHLYRNLQPDIALHYTIKPNIYGSLAARLNKTPCINMISGLGTAFIQENLLTRLIERLYRVSQHWPYRVVFLNQDDLTLFRQRRLVAPEKMLLLDGEGLDLSYFTPSPLPDTPPVFLFIGRLLADKGLREFIEAALECKRTHPNVHFRVLGAADADNRSAINTVELQSWIADGIIEYLGESPDVRPHIAAAHCIVLPSYREGKPRVLMEAAAMGRPVITTDVPGCREAVAAETTGLLCQPRNAASLLAALCAFLALPAEKRTAMGFNGRKLAEQRFDEQIAIGQYSDLIRQITATRAAPDERRS